MNAQSPSEAQRSAEIVSREIEHLAQNAMEYVEHARSRHTMRAYRCDWDDYALWCQRRGIEPLPARADHVGIYLADLARPGDGRSPLSPASIERRLAGIAWNFAQRGERLQRDDPRIREVLASVKRVHGRPPRRKAAISPDELKDMLGLLAHDLPGLRDRAILLLGYAGGLRRSGNVGLDVGRDQTLDATGWIDRHDEGLLVTLRGKTGWREVAIGVGSSLHTCPRHALITWLDLARIAHGPIFRRVGKGRAGTVGADRLNDRHVARLVKRLAREAGLSGDLVIKDAEAAYSGHSLRAGLATHADTEEHFVQRQLGHANAEMTRRYRREKSRFAINLTKASGL